MLIEAAKGGHTNVVQLLLDYPHSIIMTPHTAGPTPASMIIPPQQQQQQPQQQQQQHVPQPIQQSTTQLQAPSTPVQQPQQSQNASAEQMQQTQSVPPKHNTQKSLLRKNRSVSMMPDTSLTSAEAQQVRTQPAGEASAAVASVVAAVKDDTNILDKGSGGFTTLSEPNISLSPATSSTAVVSTAASVAATTLSELRKNPRPDQILHKQQILEELQVCPIEIHSFLIIICFVN